MTSSRKNAEKTRGRPFEKGNPGRPEGARNKTTLAAQVLLDGEAENITRKAAAIKSTAFLFGALGGVDVLDDELHRAPFIVGMGLSRLAPAAI